MDSTEHPTLIDHAAAWLAALDSGTADPRAFEAWRDADPSHAAAFAQVAATWEQLGDARSIATTEPETNLPRAAAGMSRRHLLQAAASIAVVAGVGGVGSRVWARSSAETAVGERRTILCDDGTRLDLNTDSAVEWRIRRATRQMWLERGEIALDVAPAPAALFVHIGDTAVALAPGRYNLRARAGAIDVLVLEAGRAVAGGIAARAGQRLAVAPSAARMLPVDEAARDRAAGWRRGEVVFAGEPLAVAIADYNRYLTRKLVVGNPRLATIRLGGRFTSNDPGDFLRALRASFDIAAMPRGEVMILVPARSQK